MGQYRFYLMVGGFIGDELKSNMEQLKILNEELRKKEQDLEKTFIGIDYSQRQRYYSQRRYAN